ncbi:hypothetical protein [Marinobacter nauticus]|uniref:hypothetical protein n=1 Tax=Marinobacter nauticus TaxID=2743 RepID=UPI003737096B
MNEGSSMTPQGITVVAIKFFALYLAFNILWYAPTISVYVSTYTELLETSSTQNFLIYLVAIFIAIGLIAAVGMILVANSIIRKAPTDPIETTEGFSPQLLFQLIGLYFVVTALSEFPMATLQAFQGNTEPVKSSMYFGGSLVQFAIGLYLVIKPRSWLGWFSKAERSVRAD